MAVLFIVDRLSRVLEGSKPEVTALSLSKAKTTYLITWKWKWFATISSHVFSPSFNLDTRKRESQRQVVSSPPMSTSGCTRTRRGNLFSWYVFSAAFNLIVSGAAIELAIFFHKINGHCCLTSVYIPQQLFVIRVTMIFAMSRMRLNFALSLFQFVLDDPALSSVRFVDSNDMAVKAPRGREFEERGHERSLPLEDVSTHPRIWFPESRSLGRNSISAAILIPLAKILLGLPLAMICASFSWLFMPYSYYKS